MIGIQRTNNNCCQGCGEKRNHYKLIVRTEIITYYENQYVVLQINIRSTMLLSYTTPEHLTKVLQSTYHREIFTLICMQHSANLSPVAEVWIKKI